MTEDFIKNIQGLAFNINTQLAQTEKAIETMDIPEQQKQILRDEAKNIRAAIADPGKGIQVIAKSIENLNTHLK